jgi:hypothetical protein
VAGLGTIDIGRNADTAAGHAEFAVDPVTSA